MQKKALEITFKSSLSLLVILVFAGIGGIAAEIKPFDALRGIPGPENVSRQDATNQESSRVNLPVPPYTDEAVRNETEKGDYYGYRTKLSIDGIKKFYTTELPRRDWERNDVVGEVQKMLGRGTRLLSFRKGAKRCMIYFEPKSGYTNNITVLLMDAGDFESVEGRQIENGEVNEL
ncbi:MAG: hypothetical protein ACOC0A_00145 [Planctomycetota bacterium]